MIKAYVLVVTNPGETKNVVAAIGKVSGVKELHEVMVVSAGICPNCHRRAHYSQDAADYNKKLAEVVARLEA